MFNKKHLANSKSDFTWLKNESYKSLQSEPRDHFIGISSHVFFYPIKISKGIRKHFANSNSDFRWFIRWERPEFAEWTTWSLYWD